MPDTPQPNTVENLNTRMGRVESTMTNLANKSDNFDIRLQRIEQLLTEIATNAKHWDGDHSDVVHRFASVENRLTLGEKAEIEMSSEVKHIKEKILEHELANKAKMVEIDRDFKGSLEKLDALSEKRMNAMRSNIIVGIAIVGCLVSVINFFLNNMQLNREVPAIGASRSGEYTTDSTTNSRTRAR